MCEKKKKKSTLGKFTLLDLVTFLTFVLLKILGAITWNWIWILAPLWVLGGLLELLVLIVVFQVGVNGFLEEVC